MKLSGGNLIARKNSMEVDYDAVYGTFPINSDLHYWEVKILNFIDLNDIMIGVSSRASLEGRGRSFDKFYGWHATSARKLRPVTTSSRPEVGDYGSHCKIGDKIGVILQFKNGAAKLSFTLNNEFLGTCYSDMPAGNYWPQCILYSEGSQIQLYPHAQLSKDIEDKL